MDLKRSISPVPPVLLAIILGLHAFLLEDSYGYWFAEPFVAYREIFGFSIVTSLYLMLFYIQGTRLHSVYPRATVVLGLTLGLALAVTLFRSLAGGRMFQGAGTGLLEVRVALVGIMLYVTLAHYMEHYSIDKIVRVFIRLALISAVFHLFIYTSGAPILLTGVDQYGRTTAFESGFLHSWCLAFCYCLAEALLNRRRGRNLLYGAILFAVVALSYRRSFVLILLGGVAVVFLALPAKSLSASIKRRSILALLVGLLLIVIAWGRPDLVARIDPRAFFDPDSEAYARSYSSNAGHMSDVQTGWELLREHFLLGIGLGVPFEGRDNDPIVGSMLHSLHLHTWLRTGFLGFVTLALFYGIMWWRARSILVLSKEVFARAVALMVLGVTIPHFFISFIGAPFYLQQKALFYFIFLFVVIEQLGQNIRCAARVPIIHLP